MGRGSKYYWYDGEKDAALVHGLLEEDGLDYGKAMYDSESEAYDALERMASGFDDKSRLYDLKLKKTGHSTVGEAADVLTEQTGIMSFED